MQIVTLEQVQNWLRLDPNTDLDTLTMLVSSALDWIESYIGSSYRPYIDPITGVVITPTVPESIKHAVVVFVSAHYDDRAGSTEAAMATVRNLCAPMRVPHL